MAADGLFVRAFGKTTAQGTPVTGLIATSGLATVLILLNVHRTLVGVFTFFVLLSTTAALAAYLASSLALVPLRIRTGTGGRRSGLALGILGCAGAAYSIGALAGALGQVDVLAVLALAIDDPAQGDLDHAGGVRACLFFLVHVRCVPLPLTLPDRTCPRHRARGPAHRPRIGPLS